MESILTSIKKLLGIDESYEHFDSDIVMHINTVLMTLSQIGVGPATGFMIEDENATWQDFIGTDKNLAAVKTYVYLRVKLLFDPPTNSTHTKAIEDAIREYEWRLNVEAES